VDHLLSIHSFDAPHFEAAGLPTSFVGNPALARSFAGADPRPLSAGHRGGRGDLILLVAPGSRPSEIARVLPPFAEAVRALKAAHPEVHVVVPVAETVAEAVRAGVADWPAPTHVVEHAPDKTDAMVAADVALACSGTVTTELALAGVPMVVGYRLGRLTYAVLNRIIRTPYATLFNIAAGREVAPELIQDACTGPRLAAALLPLIEDASRRETQRRDQLAALDRMGRGGPDPVRSGG
jgi:lipid-A-disaccharide synthase